MKLGLKTLLLLLGLHFCSASIFPTPAQATPEQRALAAIAARVSVRSAELRTYQRTCQQLVANALKVTEYGAWVSGADVQINSANAIYQRGMANMQSNPEDSMRSFNQAVGFLETALRYLHNGCRGVLRETEVSETCASQPSVVERAFTPIVGGTTRQANIRSVCGSVRAFNTREFSSLSQTIPIQFVAELTAIPGELAPTSPAPDCETTNGEQSPSPGESRARPQRRRVPRPSQPVAEPSTEQEEQVRRLMAAQEERRRRQEQEDAAERRRRNRRPPQLRTREVIQQELESALAQADTAHSQMIPRDVDFFLARAELSAHNRRPPITQGVWEDAVARWNRSQESYDRIANDSSMSIDERRGRIMNALVGDYLTSYERESADPLNALLGNGGNCQTRMHAINAVLSRNPHLIPPGYQLGMAVSTGHVEAVLISTDPAHNETYIDLLTNRRYSTRIREVYTPLTSVRTFLQGSGSVVASRDLLAHRSSQIPAVPLTARARAQSEIRPNMAGSQEFPLVEHTGVDPAQVPLRVQNAPPPIHTVIVPRGEAQTMLAPEDNEDQVLRPVANPQAVIAGVRNAEVRASLENYLQSDSRDDGYTDFFLDRALANPDMTLAELRTEALRYTESRIRHDLRESRAGMGRPDDRLVHPWIYGDALRGVGVPLESSLEHERAVRSAVQANQALAANPARLAQLLRVHHAQSVQLTRDGVTDETEWLRVYYGQQAPPSRNPIYDEASIGGDALVAAEELSGTTEIERVFTDPTLFGFEVPSSLLLASAQVPQGALPVAASTAPLATAGARGQREVQRQEQGAGQVPASTTLTESLTQAATAQHQVSAYSMYSALNEIMRQRLARGEVTAARELLPRVLAAREVVVADRIASNPDRIVCRVRYCQYSVTATTPHRGSCANAADSFADLELQLCPQAR